LVKKDKHGTYFCESPEIVLPRIRDIILDWIAKAGFRYHNEDQKRSFKNAWFDRGSDVLRDTAQLRQTGKAGIADKIERACQRFDFHAAVAFIDDELQSKGSPDIGQINVSNRKKTRIRHNISIAEAAKACGKSPRTIERWVAGKNTPSDFPGLNDSGALLTFAETYKCRRAIFSQKHGSGNKRKTKYGDIPLPGALLTDDGPDT
jgi:hypothetical protein